MKGNRLRACRKAVRRMAVSFATPFLKSKDVKGNNSGDKYAVGDASHDNTPDQKDESVLATDELGYTGSKLSRWINASARNDVKVTPVDDSTWAYLMGSERHMVALPGIPNGKTSKDMPKHIGSLCKDYSIFEVSGNKAKVSPVNDYTWKILTIKRITRTVGNLRISPLSQDAFQEAIPSILGTFAKTTPSSKLRANIHRNLRKVLIHRQVYYTEQRTHV
ncbi:hypothetical protein ScPMuIL_009967 [Solemya velum]